ncbi:hypothetical protein [Siccibacter turicensis]
MTNYSAYLKFKLDSDKKLSTLLTRSAKSLGQGLYDMTNEAMAGAERASWYLSCLVPGQSDICSELRHEDLRWIRSMVKAKSKNDVIFDMVELYFKRKIANITPAVEKSLLLKITEKLSALAANKASDTLNKKTLAYFLTVMILSSYDFKEALSKTIIKTVGSLVGAASFYGKVQISAMAARRLKAIHPKYYWDLYNNDIEMLYYLIEDPMSKIMYIIDSGSTDEEEITFLVNELVRK